MVGDELLLLVIGVVVDRSRARETGRRCSRVAVAEEQARSTSSEGIHELGCELTVTQRRSQIGINILLFVSALFRPSRPHLICEAGDPGSL